MNNGKKEYTFFWFIENYSYIWHKNGKSLLSPSFTVDKLEGTTWEIELYPRGIDGEDRNQMALFLLRSKEDDGPRKIFLDFELSFLAEDGSAIWCVDYKYGFIRGNGNGEVGFLDLDEILFSKNVNYLPRDVLTVRCKMWKGEGNVRPIGQSSARTRIRVEKICFIHVIKNFSTLQPNAKQTIKIRSHSKKGRFITSSLYFTEEDEMMIEIVLTDGMSTNQILSKCELSLLDESGNVVECGGNDNRYESERKNTHLMSLTLSREDVLRRENVYLPDDKLSFICKCIFSSGIEFQTMEEILNEIPLALIKQKSDCVPIINDCKAEEKPSTYPGALDDMKALYISQCLTDVEVRTETKSFPAHKVVLCARSPVFKTMMTCDMKEKNTDCIRVDDLEDDNVHRLLLFLYSDNIEDLQCGSATRLYYAADKYQINKLKEVCSSFLVENLNTTNASELLLLADTHSDGSFKKSVEDFILEHEEQVFGSKEWEALMETSPMLVMKTMHLKYKRKK